MPVVINFKVCDNAEACNALNVCPTGAFRWNNEKKTLEVNDEKCINCGLCATSEESCQVGAIRFAQNSEELEKIQKEIENDPRTIADLMADRYGGQPINMPFCCSEEELTKVLTTSKPCIIELFNDDSIECLIKSIPIKQILNNTVEDAVYRKVEIKTNEILDQYDVKKLPALLIFKTGKFLGKFEGYIEDNNKEMLFKEINRIINTIEVL